MMDDYPWEGTGDQNDIINWSLEVQTSHNDP